MQSSLDITLRYNTLCSLTVSHDYFKDKGIKRLTVEPTLETKLWLRNNRIIYKPKGNGFTLGYLDKDGKRIRSKHINEEKLTFLISSPDPYFDTYSSYDFRQMNEIIYLTNQMNGNQLSKEADVSNNDKVSCFPSKFIYKISDNSDNKPIAIKDYNMNSVWEASNNQRLQVNLAGNDIGLYHLEVGEETVQSFYMLPKIPRGLVAVVELYLKDITEDEIQYKVNFGTKKAIWRYYFVPHKPNFVYERVKIEPIRKGIKIPFTSPKVIVIHNGKKAIMIESKEPIVVQENSPYRFQLKAFKKNTQERMTIQLPNPSYKEITVDRTSNVISAQIYMKI